MSVVKLSDKQFDKLIQTVLQLAPTHIETKPKGSFGTCPITFGGQNDQDAVETFITGIETYKELEGISDANALKGISLLFRAQAATWWKGVKRDAKTWQDALKMLQEHFAPAEAPHDIYVKLFADKQGSSESIDAFICRKRALLAKLPEGTHDEDTELNFVYGLLTPNFRKQLPRHEIISFRNLLEKGRQIERTNRVNPHT